MGGPKVSVLIPAYNAEKYIGDTIQSVLDQTFQDFEVIVLDDCSTDSTNEVVKGFGAKDDRIRLFKNKTNLGIAGTRNKLLEYASGKYLAILDADDLCHRDRLAIQSKFLEENSDHILVGSYYEMIDEAANHIAHVRHITKPNQVGIGMFFHNLIAQSSVMINAALLGSERYDLGFPPAEDYHLWIRLLRKGKVHNIPSELMHYRVHAQGVSKAKAELMSEQLRKILRFQYELYGFKYDDQQIKVHQLHAERRKEELDKLPFEEIDLWLSHLVNQNRQTNAFHESEFEQFVHASWSKLLFAHVKKYNLRLFRVISKRSIYPMLPVKSKLKLFIKCLIQFRKSAV